MDVGGPPVPSPFLENQSSLRGLDLDTWFVGRSQIAKHPRNEEQGVRTRETELSRTRRPAPWTHQMRPEFRLNLKAKMVPSYKAGWWFGKPPEKLDAIWPEVIIPHEPSLKGHGVPIPGLLHFLKENGPCRVVSIMVPGLIRDPGAPGVRSSIRIHTRRHQGGR